MHGSGANLTPNGRKCLLSAFQLGWLRPEYKFWAHKELHEVCEALLRCPLLWSYCIHSFGDRALLRQALSEGKLSSKLTDLMGHVRRRLSLWSRVV